MFTCFNSFYNKTESSAFRHYSPDSAEDEASRSEKVEKVFLPLSSCLKQVDSWLKTWQKLKI